MATINLVQGDTAPQIRAVLTRSDTGLPEDLTGATVQLHFRKRGTTTLLFTLSNQSSSEEQAEGICSFVFGSGDLDVDAGRYEAEIEVVFADSTIETVYEIIEFTLREDFA